MKEKNLQQINLSDLWSKEWKRAYSFFHSKGNIHTRSRLKAKWQKELFKDLKDIEYIYLSRI